MTNSHSVEYPAWVLDDEQKSPSKQDKGWSDDKGRWRAQITPPRNPGVSQNSTVRQHAASSAADRVPVGWKADDGRWRASITPQKSRRCSLSRHRVVGLLLLDYVLRDCRRTTTCRRFVKKWKQKLLLDVQRCMQATRGASYMETWAAGVYGQRVAQLEALLEDERAAATHAVERLIQMEGQLNDARRATAYTDLAQGYAASAVTYSLEHGEASRGRRIAATVFFTVVRNIMTSAVQRGVAMWRNHWAEYVIAQLELLLEVMQFQVEQSMSSAEAAMEMADDQAQQAATLADWDCTPLCLSAGDWQVERLQALLDGEISRGYEDTLRCSTATEAALTDREARVGAAEAALKHREERAAAAEGMLATREATIAAVSHSSNHERLAVLESALKVAEARAEAAEATLKGLEEKNSLGSERSARRNSSESSSQKPSPSSATDWQVAGSRARKPRLAASLGGLRAPAKTKDPHAGRQGTPGRKNTPARAKQEAQGRGARDASWRVPNPRNGENGGQRNNSGSIPQRGGGRAQARSNRTGTPVHGTAGRVSQSGQVGGTDDAADVKFVPGRRSSLGSPEQVAKAGSSGPVIARGPAQSGPGFGRGRGAA